MIPGTLDISTVPLHGTRLIEASAGTGKTYTITQLYLRLVLGHGDEQNRFPRPLAPSQILVITFAEAAKLELRDRIRLRLNRGAAYFRGHATEDTELQKISETWSRDQREEAAKRLENASESMDEATIFTIHGWCLRTLRRYAYESGIGDARDIGDDSRDLLAEVVRDYWRSTFYRVSPDHAAVLTEVFPDPDALLQAIQPLLVPVTGEPRYGDTPRAVPDELEPILEKARRELEECRRLNGEARALWRGNEETLQQILQDLREYMNKQTFKNCDRDEVFAGWLDEIRRWARGEDDPEDPPAILRKLAPERIRLKKGASPPDHAFFTILGEWIAAVDVRDTRELATDVMLHAATTVRRLYEEEKLQRYLVDFNDMLTLLDRALRDDRDGNLRRAIREESPVVLVDEFQDTDEVQYRILDALYGVGGDDRNTGLFLIGDPKQAIYRFRGADIYSYLRARRAARGRQYSLTTNYRSRPELINAVNQLLSVADRHPRGAFLFGSGETGEVPFIPVQPRPSTQSSGKSPLILDGAPAPPLTIWVTPEDQETVQTGAFRELVAEQTARSIARWLGPGRSLRHGESGSVPLEPQDVAVLVRSRTEADAILAAFRRYGITGVYLSARDSVFESPEARDILFWLRACLDPGDTQHVRSALATPSLGLSLEELRSSAGDTLLEELHADRFTRYHDLLVHDGPLPAIRALMHDYHVPSNLLAREDGERALTNALHLAEWLHQSAATVEAPRELVRLLAERIDDPREEQVLRLERDDRCVRVVTIFKAKGLEYNVVVAPFLCLPPPAPGRNNASRVPKPVVWHEENNGRVMEFRLEKAPRAIEALEGELLSEEMRLFYVAITRARDAVFLAVAPVTQGRSKTPAIHTSGFGYLLSGGNRFETGREVYGTVRALTGDTGTIVLERMIPEGAPAPKEITGRNPAGVAPPEYHVREPRRTHHERWWIASYTALGACRRKHAERDPYPPEPERPDQEVVAEELEPTVPGTTLGTDPGYQPVAAAGIHRFPAGARAGTFLHDLIEEFAREGFPGIASDRESRETLILTACRSRGWEEWFPVVRDWTLDFLQTPRVLPDRDTAFTIAELSLYRAEMEFLFESRRVKLEKLDGIVRRAVLPGAERPEWTSPVMNGLFKGFIDLVFQVGDRYYLADWKSNRLGQEDEAYRQEQLAAAFLDKRYDLQLALYILALHRHLRARIPDYDYDRHLGGAIFVFLRGTGAETRGSLFSRPERSVLEELDELFRGGSR